ncbi:MAG: M23 family metallopeptidase [Candidatus Manganitrophus sp. SB1]|nr:M23 family metallopeptidase [Candidatus Manganitrophus morganii]
MGKTDDSYTVVILPSPTSEPYRFSLSKKTCKYLIGFSSVLILVLAGFFVQYFLMLGQITELKDLRKETKTQKIQIQSFLTSIDDLKNQMNRLIELDQKLRVITDIGPRKEVGVMGLGGQEEVDLSHPDSSKLMTSIQLDLGDLQAKAIAQEKSFQELTEAVQSRQSLWASTPSIWPTTGWLTSGYGNRVSPFTGRVSKHNGIDIASRQDTPVIAPAAGVVSYTGFDSGLGKLIKINHGYGIMTYYGHLAKAAVKVGQKVKRGDVIAYVGSTGLSTGPHLHYEIYVNDVPVNPMRYILN